MQLFKDFKHLIKLFEASLNGDIDLLKEMKTIKCGKKGSAVKSKGIGVLGKE